VPSALLVLDDDHCFPHLAALVNVETVEHLVMFA
jgi:hypothetical protein